MEHNDRQVELTDESFETEIHRSSLPVLVEFWAEWSGGCHIMAPIVASLTESLTGRIKFVRIGIENFPRTASRYGVRTVPTLLQFRSGQLVDSVSGTLPRLELAIRVERNLDKAANATVDESSPSE